nr:hypothetical protein CFP56_68369 [Quercus suber]
MIPSAWKVARCDLHRTPQPQPTRDRFPRHDFFDRPVSYIDRRRCSSPRGKHRSSIRVDSPLQSQDTFPTSEEFVSEDALPPAAVTAAEPASKSPQPPRTPSRRVDDDAASVYLFVPVHKPGKPRDKREATEIHRYVMQRWLAKKHSKREREAGSLREMRRNGIGKPRFKDSTEVQTNARICGSMSPFTSSKSSGYANSRTSMLKENAAARRQVAQRTSFEPQHPTSPSHFQPKAHRAPFVPGQIRHPDQCTPFLVTTLEQVPFPLCRFNGRLNAFDTLPVFEDTWIDVARLKWKC